MGHSAWDYAANFLNPEASNLTKNKGQSPLVSFTNGHNNFAFIYETTMTNWVFLLETSECLY